MEEYIKSVLDRLDMEKILQESQSEEERNEILLAHARKLIESDVSLGKVDVEHLLEKSTAVIGNVVYQMANWGKEIPEVSFFGEKAKAFFVFLACGYLEMNLDQMVEEFQTCKILVYRKSKIEITVADFRILLGRAYGELDDTDERVQKVIAKLKKEGAGYVKGCDLRKLAECYDMDTLTFTPDTIEF